MNLLEIVRIVLAVIAIVCLVGSNQMIFLFQM